MSGFGIDAWALSGFIFIRSIREVSPVYGVIVRMGGLNLLRLRL
jgi:hypothetical protein